MFDSYRVYYTPRALPVSRAASPDSRATFPVSRAAAAESCSAERSVSQKRRHSTSLIKSQVSYRVLGLEVHYLEGTAANSPQASRRMRERCNEISMAFIINIDVMLAKRKTSVTELADKVVITMAKISILKNGKAKAIRQSTLEAI
ncbi:helix-turn-helix domain-containing protein [Bythopirellula polymerisocia]|uniref:HTH cro/C1-type domain-containing protein n=1 Tax=Bythopirellula polymerisocia TaxID=2528003 RepID=A0A5C6CT50_9BACT|nr:helix-turn-helix domain-containing protein [Bythopirellula polymerisocia]TWU25919.1 hypothetical protein Pla144_31330 [Bythopirellula polymerisocia]